MLTDESIKIVKLLKILKYIRKERLFTHHGVRVDRFIRLRKEKQETVVQ